MTKIQEALDAEHPVVFGVSTDRGDVSFRHAWGSGWQAERKSIPRTKLGASIWHLMGWHWMLCQGAVPIAVMTPPSVDQQLP